MDTRRRHYDAIVIGAGVGGIYMLHRLRNGFGLNAIAFDKAKAVGGTWYWNRYPGARADTESFVYLYSFDRESYDGWPWQNRNIDQPHMQAYFQAVVERHHLTNHITLNTTIRSAVFGEEQD